MSSFWVIGIGVIAVIFIYVLIAYNGFVKSKNSIEEAFSTMDVYLKKRWDLVPNLVETVKGYVEHEQSTLKEIVELRNCSYEKMPINDKINQNNLLSKEINQLMALVEAYPDLKANTTFMELQLELSKIENDIVQSRKYFNAVVKEYNNKVEMFPSNVVARIMHFTKKELFVVNEEERENVKVNFK
ncbi:LemA family protein [Faecalimonas sp.]